MCKSLSRTLEMLLWTIGLVCLISFAGLKVGALRATAHAANMFDATYRDSLPAENRIANEFAAPTSEITDPDQTFWSTKRIESYASASQSDNSLKAIALLSIPNLKIRTAVYDETNDMALNLGTGRVRGTSSFGSSGNVAVAGHRDGFFRNLKDVAIGEEIQIKHAQGNDIYRVTQTLIVDPTDVSVLKKTATTTLTLITCYPFYFIGSAPQRFIVRAELQ